MKKILANIRNTQNDITGVQRYTLEIIKRLDDDVDTIKPKNKFSGLKGHIWEQLVLPSKLGDRLLWSPANTGPLLLEKQVISIMDVSPLDHPEWSSKRFSSWYNYMMPRVIKKARAIITISEFSKSRIIAHCPEVRDKVFVTHLAADEKFHKKNITNNSNLKLPSGRYILALGSIEPRKNLKFLLKAWSNVVHELPDDVYFIVSGSSSNKKVFGDYSIGRIPPRVHFTGYIDEGDLPSLYKNALALAYTPFYEGFGLPTLEGMSCGTPVITSNSSSIPEVVGNAAIMIDPLNLAQCSEAIYNIVYDQNLRSKLSADGLIRAGLFDWNITASKTLEILNGAV